MSCPDINDFVYFTPYVDEDGNLSFSNNACLENPDPVNVTGPQGLEGPQGEQGAEGPQGPQGPKGDNGKNGVNGTDGVRGPQGVQGAQGEQGERGFHFTPNVSADGDLSWTNNGELANPDTVNIRGPQGVQGVQGEVGPQGDTGATGATGPQGPAASLATGLADGYILQPIQGGTGVESLAALATEMGITTTAGASKIPRAGTGGTLAHSWLPDATDVSKGVVVKASDTDIVDGTNDDKYTTPKQLNTYGVPSGCIVMWSGATTAIPTGWALCDGTNGTPNLIDRFVVGAGDTYAVGDTGGSADISATVGSTTLTMAQMPSHQHAHGWSTKFIGGGVLYPSQFGDTTLPEQQLGFVVTNGDDAMGYATTLPNTSLAGSSEGHTHSFSADTQANLPPYYALAYIMKL